MKKFSRAIVPLYSFPYNTVFTKKIFPRKNTVYNPPPTKDFIMIDLLIKFIFLLIFSVGMVFFMWWYLGVI